MDRNISVPEVASSVTASNGVPQDKPLDLNVSLMSNTISLGEPVVLHYAITNSNLHESTVETQDLAKLRSRKDEVLLGDKGEDWLILDLVDARGRSAPRVAPFIVPRRSGIRAPNPRIPPDGHLEGWVVVSQRFVLTDPGEYRLKVGARLPYKVGQYKFFSRSATPSMVLVQDIQFILTVTVLDADRLHATAESLLADAFAVPAAHVERKGAAIRALFSIPEAHALPTWRSLVSDPHLTALMRDMAARQLARVRSIAAADLLAYLNWSAKPPSSRLGREVPRLDRLLQDMHRNGDAQLKQHIEKLYEDYGETMPATVTI